MQAKVVVVGSLNMDLVTRAERLPRAGETLVGQSFATVSGGKGANQAVAAARLGATVSMIGCVGDDLLGGIVHGGGPFRKVDDEGLRGRPGRLGAGDDAAEQQQAGEAEHGPNPFFSGTDDLGAGR